MTIRQIPVTMTTIDITSGKQVSETVSFSLMPPSDPEACQACGCRHEQAEPHNPQALYYQYAFYAEHGRWPDWQDAMAHCSEEAREIIAATLDAKGIDWRRKEGSDG